MKFSSSFKDSMAISSLPVWECGLKYIYFVFCRDLSWSLPVWECGLKCILSCSFPRPFPSLPVWECGLKLYWLCLLHGRGRVTPCVGVWIEIKRRGREKEKGGVTPCVGVWIEIKSFSVKGCPCSCHSLCGSVD